jgi:hypothetical protein
MLGKYPTLTVTGTEVVEAAFVLDELHAAPSKPETTTNVRPARAGRLLPPFPTDLLDIGWVTLQVSYSPVKGQDGSARPVLAFRPSSDGQDPAVWPLVTTEPAIHPNG